MRLTQVRPVLLFLGVIATALGCLGVTTGEVIRAADGDAGPNASGNQNGNKFPPGPRQHSDKVDLLLVVDNSTAMTQKHEFLADAVNLFLLQLAEPEAGANRIPVTDIHIGVISTSLGGRGGDMCAPAETNPDTDDHARLLNRTKSALGISEARPRNFLAWLPEVAANASKPRDPSEVGATPITDRARLRSAISELIDGVGERGCGYEAPLEAAYRFLVQPDPYGSVIKNGDLSEFSGYDFELLAQRKKFLRPDSVVVVMMITDENDASLAPNAFGERAWLFADSKTVRPGTAACNIDPMSPACGSCYLAKWSGDPNCATTLSPASTDHPNLRFFHPKQRFGVDPLYPIERYVRGFTAPRVPHRDGEYNGFDYVGDPKCVNPLFASELPDGPNAELCNLTAGPRTPDLVYFALIGGMPWQLLTEAPDDLSNANVAPMKKTLSASDYERLLGKDPMAYRFDGQHPLMHESVIRRAGAGTDDAHGGEWNTNDKELQFACTYELPIKRDCSTPEAATNACDCEEVGHPLCSTSKPVTQLRGKALPSLRPIAVARALGEQAVVGSVCPRGTEISHGFYGYRPIVSALIERVALAIREP